MTNSHAIEIITELLADPDMRTALLDLAHVAFGYVRYRWQLRFHA